MRGALALVAAWLGVSALLAFWITQSLLLSAGTSLPWRQVFAAQLVLWAPWPLLTPVALSMGRRWVQRPGGPWRWLLRSVAILVLALALNAFFVGWELAGLGRLTVVEVARAVFLNGALPVLAQALLFALLAGIGWGRAQAAQSRRRKELWDRSRLAALQARLQPHFLFNVLNAVSALVERDPRAARTMLANLGDLLRQALDGGERTEVTLREELDLLATYVDIERVRCGPRLRFEQSVELADDLSVEEILVPPLLLQPLVENAIRHGLGRDSRAGLVAVRIVARGDRLQIAVDDDGPGPPPRPRFGVGLATTRDRLDVLHGEDASLTLGRRPEGGARVEIVLPLRTADPSASGGRSVTLGA